MKTQFKKDLQTKTIDELKKMAADTVKAVAALKLDHQQNKLKNTREIFNKGKEVAILKSIIQVKKTVAAAVEAEKKIEKKVKEVKK